MIDSVGSGSVDDGNGLGQELFGKSNVFCFDCGVVFLDCVLDAGFLRYVFRVSAFGNENSFLGGFDVRHIILLVQWYSFNV